MNCMKRAALYDCGCFSDVLTPFRLDWFLFEVDPSTSGGCDCLLCFW